MQVVTLLRYLHPSQHTSYAFTANGQPMGDCHPFEALGICPMWLIYSIRKLIA